MPDQFFDQLRPLLDEYVDALLGGNQVFFWRHPPVNDCCRLLRKVQNAGPKHRTRCGLGAATTAAAAAA